MFTSHGSMLSIMLTSSAIRADDDGVRQQSLFVGIIGSSIMTLTLSEIEPALNADDQQRSSTIGNVDLKCFLRVDDDDVSTTVIVRTHAVVRSARH
jgi:hypothetical protein